MYSLYVNTSSDSNIYTHAHAQERQLSEAVKSRVPLAELPHLQQSAEQSVGEKAGKEIDRSNTPTKSWCLRAARAVNLGGPSTRLPLSVVTSAPVPSYEFPFHVFTLGFFICNPRRDPLNNFAAAGRRGNYCRYLKFRVLKHFGSRYVYLKT